MTVSTRSSNSRANKVVRRGTSSSSLRTKSRPVVAAVSSKPYADIAEQWLLGSKTNDNISIINDLDKIAELREFRDPYTNSDCTSYEIPFGLFYAMFGLKYNDIGYMIRDWNGVKYVYIESSRVHVI